MDYHFKYLDYSRIMNINILKLSIYFSYLHSGLTILSMTHSKLIFFKKNHLLLNFIAFNQLLISLGKMLRAYIKSSPFMHSAFVSPLKAYGKSHLFQTVTNAPPQQALP